MKKIQKTLRCTRSLYSGSFGNCRLGGPGFLKVIFYSRASKRALRFDEFDAGP
jgi:hypothetical protein